MRMCILSLPYLYYKLDFFSYTYVFQSLPLCYFLLRSNVVDLNMNSSWRYNLFPDLFWFSYSQNRFFWRRLRFTFPSFLSGLYLSVQFYNIRCTPLPHFIPLLHLSKDIFHVNRNHPVH